MRGSLDSPPIIVRTDRRKALLHLAVGLSFALTAWMVARAHPRSDGWAWSVMAIFGALAAGSLWELIWPGRLIIDRDGFRQSDLWRRRRWSWSEARHFRPASNRFYHFVGFDQAHDASLGRNAIDGLNQDWELPPPALAALLNQARRRWSGSGG